MSQVGDFFSLFSIDLLVGDWLAIYDNSLTVVLLIVCDIGWWLRDIGCSRCTEWANDTSCTMMRCTNINTPHCLYEVSGPFQIKRLLERGYTYRNLDPYQLAQSLIDPWIAAPSISLLKASTLSLSTIMLTGLTNAIWLQARWHQQKITLSQRC